MVPLCACALSAVDRDRDDDDATAPDHPIAGLGGTRLEDMELRGAEVVIFKNNARGFGQGRESFELTLRGALAWSVECESIWEHAIAPPGRIACVFEAETATVGAMQLALTASRNEKFTGYAIAPHRRYAIEGKTRWIVRAVSTGTVAQDPIAEIDPLPELSVAFAPNLAPDDRRTLTALALALEVMRDPRTAFRAPVAPFTGTVQLFGARTSSAAQSPARDAFLALDRPDLAGAIGVLEEELRVERDPAIYRRAHASEWSRYDDPQAFAAVFGLGVHVLSPFDSASTLGRSNTGGLDIHLGADFGRRLELSFDVALAGRSLDADALSARLGANGTVDTLSSYTNRRSSSIGLNGAGALWLHLAFRYALADWQLRPFAGLFGGYRYEPMLFKSNDFTEACVPAKDGELVCGASRGYAIESPSHAWSFGPLIGMKYPLVHSERFGLELRVEAQGHITLWSEPTLRFEGDVTGESLQTFARWKTVDYGAPTFDLVLLTSLDVRMRF